MHSKYLKLKFLLEFHQWEIANKKKIISHSLKYMNLLRNHWLGIYFIDDIKALLIFICTQIHKEADPSIYDERAKQNKRTKIFINFFLDSLR